MANFGEPTEVDTEYEIHIVVRTTGGNLTSNRIQARTHAMDNLTGIRVSFDNFSASDLAPLQSVIERIGATWTEDFGPENTHLVCGKAGGDKYTRAGAMNIPVVNENWLRQCEAQKKVQPVGAYALPAESTAQ